MVDLSNRSTAFASHFKYSCCVVGSSNLSCPVCHAFCHTFQMLLHHQRGERSYATPHCYSPIHSYVESKAGTSEPQIASNHNVCGLCFIPYANFDLLFRHHIRRHTCELASVNLRLNLVYALLHGRSFGIS